MTQPMDPAMRETLERLSRQLADQGKLIESGWIGLRIAAVPPDASAEQVQSMRDAFMAGAQHLFASIMTVLDADAEPTPADLRRMMLISDELDAFGETLKLQVAALTPEHTAKA